MQQLRSLFVTAELLVFLGEPTKNGHYSRSPIGGEGGICPTKFN